MTLYKHLVYVDFVGFIKKVLNCYLKDTCEFFPTLGLAKNNPWIGCTLQRGIRFSLSNCLITILHGDVRVETHRFYFKIDFILNKRFHVP